MKLSLELIIEEPNRIGIDSFVGTMREFKLYLAAQRKLIEAGIIA